MKSRVSFLLGRHNHLIFGFGIGLAKFRITCTETHSRNGLPTYPAAQEQSGTWNLAFWKMNRTNKIKGKLIKSNPV